MVMTFIPAPVTKHAGTANVEVSKDTQIEVKEAWDWFQANPGAHLYTEPFADDAARAKWERQAKAFAATLGLRLRIVRDDAKKAECEASKKPVVRFHIESEEQYAARVAAKEAHAAELAAQRAAGVEIKRGRKPGSTVKAA